MKISLEINKECGQCKNTKNDYPLIIQYTIASLGIIKLCLAPNTNTN